MLGRRDQRSRMRRLRLRAVWTLPLLFVSLLGVSCGCAWRGRSCTGQTTHGTRGCCDPVGVSSEFCARIGSSGLPVRIQRDCDGAEMVLVPAGEFLMGAAPSDHGAPSEERPQRRVVLSRAYYLDVHEVTVGQWRAYVRKSGCELGKRVLGRLPASVTDELPITYVSYCDAMGFRLEEKTSELQ